MASASHRASLEPLIPALVGIGLLHVLGGMMLWIVLPMLPSAENAATHLPASLVWRAPEDFVGETASMSPEGPKVAGGEETQPAGAKSAASTNIPKMNKAASATATSPVTAATPAAAAKPGPIQFTPAGKGDTSVSLAPTGLSLIPAGTPSSVIRQLPPDTLGMLQSSIGASSGIDMSSGMPTSQSLVAAPPVPAVQPGPPPASMAVAPPEPSVKPQTQESSPGAAPARQTQGREANKYITLSPIVDQPSAPSKPTLSLLDIAKLNELKRAQKTDGEASSGLDAVDSALEKALMRAWMAPSTDLVPAHQRRVSVEMFVLRNGTIKNALLVIPSGSPDMDASVRAALARVPKIPESLPATYPKEHYAVRVNLQIE